MRYAVLFFMMWTGGAQAQVFFTPHAAVGYNVAQGTNFLLGVDFGMHLENNLSAGIGAYYSAGEHPSDDREIAAGPFVSFVQPLTSFFALSLREDINYVDQFDPIKSTAPNGNIEYSHNTETGVISATSVAAHISFTPNLMLSGGYRFVLALTNNALDNDRSGAFFGLTFGI